MKAGSLDGARQGMEANTINLSFRGNSVLIHASLNCPTEAVGEGALKPKAPGLILPAVLSRSRRALARTFSHEKAGSRLQTALQYEGGGLDGGKTLNTINLLSRGDSSLIYIF